MSALHPEADMCSAQADVRFVPEAGISMPCCFCSIVPSVISTNRNGRHL